MDRPAPSASKAILFKVLAVVVGVIMLTCVKAVKDVPVTEVVFFRCFFPIVPIWLWLRWRGERLWPAFRTRRPLVHLARGILGVFVMLATFLSVQLLPLPEAITLQYSQPFFVVAFSAIILGERVRFFRWGAVAFGFLGVVVVTWPNLTLLTQGGAVTNEEVIGAAAALAGAAGYATTVLIVGNLVRTDSPITVVLWFWVLSSILTVMTAPFGWVALGPWQLALLVISGILGGSSHLLLAQSLRFAPATTTAAFEYSSLVFATAFGFMFFGDVPGIYTVIGGAMVISAGLLILWRERKIERPEIAAAPKV